jgi:hypothetical protein
MKARRSEKKAGRIRKGDQRRHSAKPIDRSQRGDEMEPLDADVGFETGNEDYDFEDLVPPPVR